MRKGWPFILAGAVVLIIVVLQLYLPKPIDWRQTFERKHKIPFGEYLTHEFLPQLFPGKKIEVKDRTVYEVLDYFDYSNPSESEEGENYQEETTNYSYDTTTLSQNTYTDEEQTTYNESITEDLAEDTVTAESTDDTATYANEEYTDDTELNNSSIIPDAPYLPDTTDAYLRNYIFINSSLELGETDANALLNFVYEGNSVFIAAQSITGKLADSLNLEINVGVYESNFSTEDLNNSIAKDSTYLFLLNGKLSTNNKKYWYRTATASGYFSSFDTLATTVLGKNKNDQATFIKVKHGVGELLISTTPVAFTNYHMVYGKNAEYISAAFSYLPVRDTYWDEYYKNFREHDNNSLRFIESQPPLSWAYYIAIFGGLVYIVFESKRRQRAIPIVEPPKNTTLEFVSTIGQLYFQRGNHKDIGLKKANYFLEYLRTNFYVSTNELDSALAEKVAERSGIAKEKVTQLFMIINHYLQGKGDLESDLLELTKRIEEFKKNSKV